MIFENTYYCIGCELPKDRLAMYYIQGEIGICKKCKDGIHTTKDMTFEGKQYIDIVISPFLYDGIVSDAVRAFKFGNKRRYGEFLTDLALFYINDIGIFNGYNMIVPVPLHKNRLKERGYNQSDIIAKRLGRRLNVDVDCGALIRTRDTLHQSSLNGLKRIENVRNAFCARDADLTGKQIILVDDIYTMGETANECAKALKSSGTEKVAVFSLCKTVQKEKSSLL